MTQTSPQTFNASDLLQKSHAEILSILADEIVKGSIDLKSTLVNSNEFASLLQVKYVDLISKERRVFNLIKWINEEPITHYKRLLVHNFLSGYSVEESEIEAFINSQPVV